MSDMLAFSDIVNGRPGSRDRRLQDFLRDIRSHTIEEVQEKTRQAQRPNIPEVEGRPKS